MQEPNAYKVLFPRANRTREPVPVDKACCCLDGNVIYFMTCCSHFFLCCSHILLLFKLINRTRELLTKVVIVWMEMW